MEMKPINSDSRLTVTLARHHANAESSLRREQNDANLNAVLVAFHYMMVTHKTKSNREAFVRTRPQTRLD